MEYVCKIAKIWEEGTDVWRSINGNISCKKLKERGKERKREREKEKNWERKMNKKVNCNLM